jgi:hypothetical protein
MLTGDDVLRLIQRANAAIEKDPFPVGGGWKCRATTRAPYVGALFDWEGKPWVVCRGRQSGTRAQLLDATAGLMQARQTEHALALLTRPAEMMEGELPSLEYQTRMRAAAWQGWDVLWVNVPEFDPKTVQLERDLGPSDPSAMTAATSAILAAASARWAEFRHSPDAEPHIRAALDPLLLRFGFRPAPRSQWSFRAFWRGATCDGLWMRESRAPRTVALEVKVSEDGDAPACQVTDDLGAFDAVIAVRLYTEEAVRHRIEDDSNLRRAREDCTRKVPVTFLGIRFCSLCRRPLEELSYPNLVCKVCEQRAVGPDGRPPHVSPPYDQGDNPVFLDGKKCWRRYRFGGWIAMLDPDDCLTLDEFYGKHLTEKDS